MGPWIPIGLAALMFVGLNVVWFFRAPQLFHVPAMVWVRIGICAVPGAIMAGYSAFAMPHLIAAVQQYQTDPSCTPGSMSERAVPPGPCRVERVALTHAYRTSGGRSGIHYFVTVNFADGTARRVELAYAYDGARLFAGVIATPGTAARAQIFNGQVIMMTSDRGNATTPDLPQSRARRMEETGGIGVGLLMCAVLSLLVSWRVVAGDASAVSPSGGQA
jgi:hypothetical protein